MLLLFMSLGGIVTTLYRVNTIKTDMITVKKTFFLIEMLMLYGLDV